MVFKVLRNSGGSYVFSGVSFNGYILHYLSEIALLCSLNRDTFYFTGCYKIVLCQLATMLNTYKKLDFLWRTNFYIAHIFFF